MIVWQSASQPNLIIESSVHVWRINCDLPHSEIAQWRNILSDAERAQMDRFYDLADAIHYAACHGQVRQILATYLNTSPEKICFTHTPFGKPLIDPVHNVTIQFNLSHSCGWALLAVTNGARVGIDLEAVEALDNYVELAEISFIPATLRQWKQATSTNQQLLFFQLWTLQESLLKAYGIGFSPRSQSIYYTQSNPYQIISTLDGQTDHWSTHQFTPVDSFAASLIIEGADCVPQYFTFAG